jgi:hypothetical protein
MQYNGVIMTDYNLKYHNMIKMKCCYTHSIGYKNLADIVGWRTALLNGLTVRDSMDNSLISRFVL